MSGIFNAYDFQRLARRRLPRMIYDFIAGGAGDERGIDANTVAFNAWRFLPHRLRDVSSRDLTARLWFARDIPSMAAALGTEPVLLVSRSSDEDPVAVTPLPVDTAGIPNNHLQYAITWFLLAGVWIVMTAYLLVSLRDRKTKV